MVYGAGPWTPGIDETTKGFMKRTQIWCDYHECGRIISDKRVNQGEENYSDIDNSDSSWQIWSPKDDDDAIFCSAECMTAYCMEKFG
jgi:hypothetical protein